MAYTTFLFIGSLSICAQSPKIERIKEQLQTQKAPDTVRVNLLTSLSMLLRATDIEAAEKNAREAIDLAKTISYPRGHARALNALAVISRVEGNPQRALHFLLKALNINKILSDTSGIAQTLNGIGATYVEMNSYDDALEHFEQVLELRKAAKDTSGIAVSLANLGDVFEKMEEYQKSIEYHQQSMNYDLTKGNKENIDYSLHSLGRIYNTLENREKAKHYLLQALAIRKRSGFHYGIAETSIELGLMYQGMNNPALALLSFQEGMLGAQRAKANALQVQGLKGLAESHKALGQLDKSTNVYELYISLKDSIFTLQKQQLFTKLMAQYEADRKEKENLLLKKEQELREQYIARQDSNIVRMTLVITVLIVLLGAGVMLYRNKRKTNQLLVRFNDELSKQQKEIMEQSQRLEEANEHISLLNTSLEEQVKDRTQALEESTRNMEMYLYRSAHDLRGPIASIQGLIKIAPLMDDPNEYQQMFVRIDGLTQNMLSILEKLNTLASLDDYMIEIIDWNALLSEVRYRHRELTRKKKVKWNVNAPDNEGVLTSDSRLLKQLLSCLVENALQFSYEKSAIMLSVEEEENSWKIKVTDEGIGMEDFIQRDAFKPYFRGHEKSQGHGLGLYLAKRITDKLSGEINLYSTPREGTTIEVILPLALHQNIGKSTSKVA